MQVSSATATEAPKRTAPTSFRIFATGRNVTSKGTHTLTTAAANSIVSQWRARNTDLHVDYEHHGTSDSQDAAPAAAWFGLEARPDGLYAVNVRWTPRAKAYLESGEYRYFSPTYVVGQKSGDIEQLINVALTNLPATYDLQPLVAASDKTVRTRAKANPKGSHSMSLSLEQKQYMMEQFNKFLETCDAEPASPADLQTKGIDDGEPAPIAAAAAAAPDDVAEAIAPESPASQETVAEEDAEGDNEVLAALMDAAATATGLGKDATADELIGALLGLAGIKSESETMAARVGELEAVVAASAREARVSAAIETGKIAPHQRTLAMSLNDKQLDGLISTARPLRPVGKIVAASRTVAETQASSQLDDTVNRMFGLTK